MNRTPFGVVSTPPTMVQTLVPISPVNQEGSTVLVEGVPSTNNTDLSEDNVYWIRTKDGRIIACLKRAHEFRRISLKACQVIWPQATKQDCSSQIIVTPGITRPFLPRHYAHYILSKKDSRSTYNKDICIVPSLLKQSYSAFTRGFFAAPARNIEVPYDADTARSRLIDLLEEMRRQSVRCPELYKDVSENTELSQLRTLDDIKVYPYSRFLLQFFTFFFPTKTNRESTEALNSDVQMGEYSGGNS